MDGKIVVKKVISVDMNLGDTNERIVSESRHGPAILKNVLNMLAEVVDPVTLSVMVVPISVDGCPHRFELTTFETLKENAEELDGESPKILCPLDRKEISNPKKDTVISAIIENLLDIITQLGSVETEGEYLLEEVSQFAYPTYKELAQATKLIIDIESNFSTSNWSYVIECSSRLLEKEPENLGIRYKKAVAHFERYDIEGKVEDLQAAHKEIDFCLKFKTSLRPTCLIVKAEMLGEVGLVRNAVKLLEKAHSLLVVSADVDLDSDDDQLKKVIEQKLNGYAKKKETKGENFTV